VDKVADGDLQPAISQADINAALNLALRAIADPRLWEIHPRMRTQRCGGTVAKGRKAKVVQAEPPAPFADPRLFAREKRKFGEAGPALNIQRREKAKADDTRQPNFFADLADLQAIAGQLVERDNKLSWLTDGWTSAKLGNEDRTPPLLHGKTFWGCVKAAQWQRVSDINSARLTAWNAQADEKAFYGE
jgi:hypothetical protein